MRRTMSVYRHFQCPLRVQIVHTHSRFSAFAQKLRPACSRYSCVQNNQIRLYLFQPRLQISFEATRYENRINFYSRNSVMARRGGIEEKKCAVAEQKQTVIKFGIAAFKTVMQAHGTAHSASCPIVMRHGGHGVPHRLVALGCRRIKIGFAGRHYKLRRTHTGSAIKPHASRAAGIGCGNHLHRYRRNYDGCHKYKVYPFARSNPPEQQQQRHA